MGNHYVSLGTRGRQVAGSGRVNLILLAGALALAGCSGGQLNKAASDPGSAGTIKIGLDLPLSGEDIGDGLPAKQAVDLAIRQAARVCGASRHRDACYELQAFALDDVVAGIHDPAQGAKNVIRFTRDPLVLGVIGPLYDSLARAEIPVSNSAELVMVSPATTDECLTQEPSDGHCEGRAAKLRPRGPINFFRVVTTQLDEGAGAAQFAFASLGRRKAFVVKEQSPFGMAVANQFGSAFAKRGGTVVGSLDIVLSAQPVPAAAASAIEQAQRLSADVMYFGGTSLEAAAQLRERMGPAMTGVSFLGTDRLANNQFAKLARANARGSYFLDVGPVSANLATARRFNRDYAAAYHQAVPRYGLPAFDATNILIAAIGRAIDDADGKPPSRAQVRAEMAATPGYRGAMGVTSFDPNGDTRLKLLTAYQWLAPTDVSARYVAGVEVR